MSEPSRRTVLRSIGAGTGAVAASAAWVPSAAAAHPTTTAGDNPVVRENRAPGSDQWAVGCAETRGVDPHRPQIQGRAARDSVAPGEPLRLHLTAPGAESVTVAIYRLGHYGGARARHLLTETATPGLWSRAIPATWVSGLYLAVLTTPAGHRAHTPFVVHEPARNSALLHVVSGEPGADASVGRWLEEEGYDVTYATAADLRARRVDPARAKAVVTAGTAVRGPRVVHLDRPSALSEPGRTKETARRAAAEALEAVGVSRSRS